MLDFNEQIPIIVRELLYRFNDGSPSVVNAAHGAFDALSTRVPAEELVNHIEFIRNLIASMVSDARRRKGGVGDGEFLLPGFNIPKGKTPFVVSSKMEQNEDMQFYAKMITRHLRGGKRLVFLIVHYGTKALFSSVVTTHVGFRSTQMFQVSNLSCRFIKEAFCMAHQKSEKCLRPVWVN
jgi:hypothetical protein